MQQRRSSEAARVPAHAATGKQSPRSATARISECPAWRVQGLLYLSDFRQWRHGEEIISQALRGSCRLPKRGQLQPPCLKSWQCLAPKPHLPVLNCWILVVRIAHVGLCHHEQKSATLLAPNRQAVLDAHSPRQTIQSIQGRRVAPSIYLSIYAEGHPFITPSIRRTYLPTYLPLHLSINQLIYLSTCLSLYLSTYLSTSLYLYMDLSVLVFLDLFIYPPIALSFPSPLYISFSFHPLTYLSIYLPSLTL